MATSTFTRLLNSDYPSTSPVQQSYSWSFVRLLNLYVVSPLWATVPSSWVILDLYFSLRDNHISVFAKSMGQI